MSELVLDGAARDRVVTRLAELLKLFHDAEKKNEGGFESVSWRGQVGGFRGALNAILGQRTTGEILEAVRQQTRLGFPHVGPVTDGGEILGFDSEAAPDL